MTEVGKNPDVAKIENPPTEGNQLVYLEPAIQKQVVRKLDWNLMPLVLSLCKSSLS